MELSGKIKITIEADDEDNNYCSKECLYFMPSICNLSSIIGGSDYRCKEHYITIEKHLDIKSYDIKIIDNNFSVISYDTIGKPTIETFDYYYKLIHFLDNNLSN